MGRSRQGGEDHAPVTGLQPAWGERLLNALMRSFYAARARMRGSIFGHSFLRATRKS